MISQGSPKRRMAAPICRLVGSPIALTVFIADDFEPLRALVRAILESDCSIAVVGEAANGLEAVAGVMAHRPDVLILDLAMPGMDGFEVMVHVRERAPETKVVVLSSLPGEQMADAALELGAARYVEKSLDVQALRDVVLAV